MTFLDMYEMASHLSFEEKRKNCIRQREQYLSITKGHGDKWSKAADRCSRMLLWLDEGNRDD